MSGNSCRSKAIRATYHRLDQRFLFALLSIAFLYFAIATTATLDGQEKSSATKKTKTDETSLLKQKGPIQDIAKPLDDLIDLKWRNGQLDLRMKRTYQEVDPVVDAIREVVGWGGNSSYGGNDGYTFEISSEKITGYIKRGKQDKVSTTSVLINEIVKPNRSLHISVTDDGLLRITINASQSAYMLRVRQATDGQFMVQELDGTNVFAGAAADFDSFCRDYREYASNRLLPMLKHFSVGQVLTPYSPKIQQRVAELITPWTDDDLNQVRELTEALNSNSWQEREAATAKLEKEYKGNEALLARLVHDKQFHPETRSRTRKLIREKVEKDQLSELDFVDRVASSLDAAYLVDLIQLQTDPAVREVLVQRLRTLAPDLGDSNVSDADVVSLVASQTLNAWASDQVGEMNEDPAIDVMNEKGHFQKVSEHTGQLVRLIWHEDSIRVDRDHWKEPFGGRNISDISKEIKELVEKNNLPADWYNGGGPEFTEGSAKHPQVLFEKLEEKCGGNDNNVHRSYSSSYPGQGTPNRQFDKAKMKGELTFDKKARSQRGRRSSNNASGSLARKPFLLELTEKAGPQRSLVVDEAKPGEIRILVTGDSANYIVQLLLKKDEAIVQDIRGSQVQAFQAKTFRQLLKENEAYFRDSFFPLLRHLGVKVDPEIDAGVAGNETSMNATTTLQQSVADK